MANIRLHSLNDVKLVGRLTRDPEVRYTTQGTPVCHMRVAVGRKYKDRNSNEWKEEVAFVPCVVWRETAERCGQRLKKGSPVFIEGRLKSKEWQTKEGQNVLGEGGPITIPPDSSISVAPDGTISVVPTFGVPNTTNVVGRVKLVNPPEDQLERGADGLFRQKNGQPANLDANVRLAPETLEGSNVNVVDAMVDMISVARQFEMQMKMLQNADTNARAASQLLTVTR